MISEQDVNFESNAILSELDKGLRSCRLGDESKAIVCFPDLFAKHPFPILINSACLKLAELFRNGSNFSRLLILRVLQQAEKHLEKILNLDEFVRRITSVCYSNDPVARAITLRVLGSIACVASQRKNIHHAIRNSLDSTDEIEVQAAIEAAALFAKQSAVFALSIYPKILSILNSTSDLSVDTKIKLLSVLHHEHYNSEVSRDVRQRCLTYLNSNESDYFISSVLHTLTYISITSLTDIPDQISVLLNIFGSSANLKLKHEIIKELQLLTKTSPHFWSKANIADFVGVLKNILEKESKNQKAIRNSPGLICGFLVILQELIRCPCLLANNAEDLRAFYAEAKQFCLAIMLASSNRLNRSELNKTTNCLRVMTELSGKSPDVHRETIDLLANFLSSTVGKLEDHHFDDCTRSCKLILACVVKTANQSEEASQRLIQLLCSMLADRRTSNRLISLLCETICAIENKTNNLELVGCIRQAIVAGDRQLDDRSFISLCTVYFQLTTLSLDSLNLNLQQLNIENRCAWFYYKLLRQTMRYGHHEISLELCDKLQYHASNENIYFWFMGLLKISEAECSLIRMDASSKEDSILASIELLSESLSFLKAAILENYPQNFACEFIKLRSKFLHNNLMLIKYCKMIRSSPAASISNLIALNQRDDILKCGSIVNQMRENCKEFRKLADDYSELYQNSFNADQNTLTCLQLLQNCCTIMAEAIESVFHANRLTGGQTESDFCVASALPEHHLLKSTCNEVRARIRSMFTVSDCRLPVQTEHLLEISGRLLRIPIVLPRYFFQPLQSTALKLAISPQPKSNALEQSIVIYSNTNFAFRVEGLIKNGQPDGAAGRRKTIREVNQILIQVTSITKSNLSNLSIFDFNKKLDSPQRLQSIATPHNDYFQEQFLLNLKTGYHQINVEAFVIDQTHAQWNVGAASSLNVKVLEAT